MLAMLVAGSCLIVFGSGESTRPYREHMGVILLLYGFLNFNLFLFGYFLPLVREQTFFALLKMGLWINLMVIGFTLGYPLLEKHLFSSNRELQFQGQKVYEGFNSLRLVLGLGGLVLALLLLFIQLNLF